MVQAQIADCTFHSYCGVMKLLTIIAATEVTQKWVKTTFPLVFVVIHECREGTHIQSS